MILYFAAPLATAPRTDSLARAVALWSGCALVSGWHGAVAALPAFDRGDPIDEQARRRILANNLADLARAECVVVLADQGTPRATLVEVGMALARGVRVVWVHNGDRGRCIFDSHERVTRVDLAGVCEEVAVICGAVARVERERAAEARPIILVQRGFAGMAPPLDRDTERRADGDCAGDEGDA